MSDHRRIDVLVAEHVMGQKRVADCGLGLESCPGRYEPLVFRPCLAFYSSNIEDAWKVVEHYAEAEFVAVAVDFDQGEVNPWICVLQKSHALPVFEAAAHTASLAICLAALRCEGVEVTP